MTSVTRTDIAVIGMGPVGKLAALVLARKGYSVVVCDRKDADYPLPRAVAQDDEISRLFQSIGLPVDEHPEVFTPYDDLYRWLAASGEPLEEVDFRGLGPSGWAFMTFYHQPSVEALLASALDAEPRVEIVRGARGRVTDQTDDEVSLELSAVADGTVIRRLTAQYVLACDGANSGVRTDLGIGWHDLGFAFDWLVVDVAPGPGVASSTLALQICDPERPTTEVPSGPGRRRWEFMLRDGEDAAALTAPERVAQFLEPHGVTPENSTIERAVVYTFRAGWAQSWRRGRVFLLGDAAHLMPPFAGQGLANGYRDVLNLSFKLDLTMRGLARDGLLDTYETERRSNVEEWIGYSMALGQIICITDPAAAAERDAAMSAMLHSRNKPEPPPAPRLGAGVHEGDAGGTLSVQGFIDAGSGRRRFDDVFGAGALISRADVAGPGEEQRRSLDAAGIAVTRIGTDFDDLDGTYSAWLDRIGADAVLVRPDFEIFGTVPPGGEVDALTDRYLAQTLR